jgi:hypothetical protein
MHRAREPAGSRCNLSQVAPHLNHPRCPAETSYGSFTGFSRRAPRNYIACPRPQSVTSAAEVAFVEFNRANRANHDR